MNPFALWDRIRVPGERRAIPAGAPADIRSARRVLRTAIYERAAAGTATDEEIATLTSGHRQRVAYWCAPPASVIPRWTSALVNPIEELILFPVAAVLLAAGAWIISTGLWPIVAAALIVLLVVRGRARNRRVDCAAAVRDRTCPDCGYDLSAAVPAIAPERIGGESVGPRLCPECGAPWPLVPPWVPHGTRSRTA